jgi:ACS family hexuronate transporter-like MFS transporter
LSWQVALVAALTMTVSYVDRQTFQVLGYAISKDLQLSESAYGLLAAAFSASYMIATPFAGIWIDRIGARRGLVSSVLAWSTVAALHAVAPGFWTLLVLRLLLGFTESPGFPAAAQTVQRILGPEDRARAFGILFTGSSIGAMLVPPAATFIYKSQDSSDGWRAALLITAVAGMIWLPLWLLVTRSREVRARLDVAPAAVVASISLRELIVHPVMVRALCAIFAIAPVFGFPAAWGSKYLNREFGLEQAQMGWLLVVPPLMFDAGAILFGDLASRQRRAPGAPPLALFAVGALLATALGFVPLAQTPWQAIIITGIGIGGAGAAYTLVTADLLARIPPGSISLAGGIMAVGQSLSLVIGNPLIGWMVETQRNYDVVNVLLGLWVIPGSLVWLLWRPRPIGPRGPHTTG